MNRAAPFLTLVLAACAFTTACGDDGGGSSFAGDGVYTITAWTENADSCDAEGMSVLADKSDTPLLGLAEVRQEFIVSFDVIQAATCATAQECANALQGGVFGSVLGQSWSFSPDDLKDGGWEQMQTISLSDADMVQTCDGIAVITRLTLDEETSTARIEIRRYEDLTWDVAFDDDFMMNTCVFFEDDRVERAIEAGTCNTLEVITANSPQPVPPAEPME